MMSDADKKATKKEKEGNKNAADKDFLPGDFWGKTVPITYEDVATALMQTEEGLNSVLVCYSISRKKLLTFFSEMHQWDMKGDPYIPGPEDTDVKQFCGGDDDLIPLFRYPEGEVFIYDKELIMGSPSKDKGYLAYKNRYGNSIDYYFDDWARDHYEYDFRLKYFLIREMRSMKMMRKWVAEYKKRVGQKAKLEEARNEAIAILQSLCGDHLYQNTVKARFDETWGPVVEATLNLNAREAMRVWLKAEDSINKKFHLVVKWTGENDLTEDELVGYLAEIGAKAGPLRAKPGFDAVKLVREIRGDDDDEY